MSTEKITVALNSTTGERIADPEARYGENWREESRGSGRSRTMSFEPLTVNFAGIRDLALDQHSAPGLVSEHPELAGCTYRVIGERGVLDAGDVYRDGKHIGCIEDEGQGYVWHPGCRAEESESFHEGGWAHGAE